MIENKELPSEYVSIRQVWLQNINRCSEAISNRSKPDASEEANFQEVGNRTVVYTVGALYHSLVDYGEAIVRTEVKQYYENKYNKGIDQIWKDYKNKKLEASNSWEKTASLSIKLYDYIIQTLNKYGMLFEEQPQGYSNVIMEVIE